MERRTQHRERRSILIAVLFLILGGLIVWLAKVLLKIEGDAIFITLLLVPILVYLIASGRLTELRGPGGLELKLSNVAESAVELPSEPIKTSVSDVDRVTKMGPEDLYRRIDFLDETKPITFSLTLGRIRYSKEAVLQYMDTLLQYRTFKFVVLLDDEDNFVAYIPSRTMFNLLKMEDTGDQFIQSINEGNVLKLQKYPGVITKALSIQASNVDALREMTERNLEALVVIDKDQKIKGVVEREQIVNKLLLGISGR